jgi:hypothetical protein
MASVLESSILIAIFTWIAAFFLLTLIILTRSYQFTSTITLEQSGTIQNSSKSLTVGSGRFSCIVYEYYELRPVSSETAVKELSSDENKAILSE